MAALRTGDRATAIRWLSRAHRLAPVDANIALSLATACLGEDDARAAGLFQAVLADNDVREAWLGLAGARLRSGDAAGAAAALAEALQRHSVAVGMGDFADAIVAADGAPGWCGLVGSGVVTVRAVHAGVADVRLNGKRLTGKLPTKAWAAARWLSVMVGDKHLLGSPIDIAAIGRTEGCVEPREGGMGGWVWHPGDPETDPVLTIGDASNTKPRRLTATDESIPVQGQSGLSRPRAFHVPAERLAGLRGPFHVTGRDGRDLAGSPLDPEASMHLVPIPVGQPQLWHAPALPDEPRQADVAILVRGLSASAHDAIAACPGRDVVLLEADTLMPPGWLDRLRAAAYSAPDIGTVTPLSNRADYLTYASGGETALDLPATVRLDRLARQENGPDVRDIPSGLGFCVYIRRACLDAVGPLRPDIFAENQGAVTDFCLRAGHLGWRHVALPGLFVARGGSAAEAEYARTHDETILNRLHPGYAAAIQAFRDADPLADVRKRLDLARWRAIRPRQPGSVVLISHADGGGVEHGLIAAAIAIQTNGLRPIVLRPALAANGREAVTVGDGPAGGFPDLRFSLPVDMPALLRLLRATRPAWVEVHHVLNHPPAIYDVVRRLDVPYDVFVHDYAWMCPRISLMGAGNRYCGEPDLAGCDICIASLGRLIREDIGVAALRRRSAEFLGAARRVIAPSRDAATRTRRYFPALRPEVQPHGDDRALVPSRFAPAGGGAPRVCLAGGIGPHKGYDILLACARDAAERRLPLEFVVVGDTTGDEPLLATGRVFITGTYQPDEAVALIGAQQANLGFLPSVWPETWSLTLTELWQAGLPVAAFDIGAPADRIRATGRGFLLPLGLPPAAINNALLAAIGPSGHG